MDGWSMMMILYLQFVSDSMRFGILPFNKKVVKSRIMSFVIDNWNIIYIYDYLIMCVIET